MALIQGSSKMLFYINSNDRVLGDQQDFIINLDFDGNLDFDRVVVLQMYIPMSYWLIRKNQNTFQLQENSTVVTITIPLGNYTRSSMATIISNLLSTASPNAWLYTVSFPNLSKAPDQGYYTFTVSGNSSQPSLIFGSNLVYESLGFNLNTTYTFLSNTLISIGVINLKPENTVFLHSSICSNKNDDILQEVYSNSATYSSIVFQQFDVESNSKEIAFNQSCSYRFYLTDENNNIINLNNQNIVFTLMMYKKNTIFSMVSDYLNYLFRK